MRRCSIATRSAASPGRPSVRVARPRELAVAGDCSKADVWRSICACPLLSEADIAGSVGSLDRAAYDPQRSSPDRTALILKPAVFCLAQIRTDDRWPRLIYCFRGHFTAPQ